MSSADASRAYAVAATIAAATALLSAAVESAGAEPGDTQRVTQPISHLIEAYPDSLTGIDGNWLVWRDGTRMPLDDGIHDKPFKIWLDAPDVEDMLRLPYPYGADSLVPSPDSDPGRARNAPFFDKMYGDCRKGDVQSKLRAVAWLPSKTHQKLEVTTVNGVAARLEAVSRELDALPAEFDKYLVPAAGTYNCRTIAGTNRTSAHGLGIAIDIAVGQSDYWQWAAKRAPGSNTITYRNRIPLQIVHIFERQGFIWGGRWYHYDTMHFEYRPELLPRLEPLEPDRAPR
jgi:hypothetical protein